MSNNEFKESGWGRQPTRKTKRNKYIGWGKQASKKGKRSEEVQKASKSRGAWSTNPIPVKEIKHEGFGGNLNPKWQWPKDTVVRPLYEGWDMFNDRTYAIKKKKKKVYWTVEDPWKKH